jgi:hypothetical protein
MRGRRFRSPALHQKPPKKNPGIRFLKSLLLLIIIIPADAKAKADRENGQRRGPGG